MKQVLAAGIMMFGVYASAFAQAPDRFFQAQIRGGGGDGKCTIEVNVDGTALVEINGDRGRLITVNGQPAEWRRFQCNQRMPSNPDGFRFTGVDGRGRQSLERDPSRNRGVAVVRIEDPQGGREGYTFDIEWRGGSDSSRGYDNSRGYGPDRRDDGRGDRGGRDNVIRVTCSSDDGRRHYCDTDTRNGVRLVRQISGSECREGATWGYDRRGVWVDRGCRADFEVRR